MITGEQVREAIMTLIRYDQQFEGRIPDRKGRTVDAQTGLIIRELGEFLDAEKHKKSIEQGEELVDFILSAVTMAMVWNRNKKMEYIDFLIAVEQGVLTVDHKLCKRWLPENLRQQA